MLCISALRGRTGCGDMRPQGTTALTIAVCCVVVGGCAGQLAQFVQEAPTAAKAAPTPSQAAPAPQAAPTLPQAAPTRAQEAPKNDASKDPRRALVNAVNLCVIREAQTKSLSLVDPETAAYAVVARCDGSLREFKSYMAGHFPGNPPQFETWWRAEEEDTLDFAKKAVALDRAQ
jgi:hypothetical protein